ncbi:arsenate-mycothiol transferase ArsC [Gelidibacter pelagius]|uniref:Protein-tyrosine-phosphatase n=1 Tax=Gelidibacter pelagius TaxID=2819985 RepID=A0ABS3SWE6_9FLAO|nr:protein-tyrosine-phosphatase [Gelidibacter pelagius]MBO3100067.1 protein-tyrosine-phosphatase [Gelidibacter pelagius]
MIFPKIEHLIAQLKPETITVARTTLLQPLVAYIQAKVDQNQVVNLHFICTHNSRRSHLSQVWAQTMAHHFKLKNVYCYSGGTDSTALFPMVAETLRKSGFQIDKLSKGKNPIYNIKYAANAHPIIGFSKRLEDDFNPTSEFAAIMTCDSANEACPFVPGSEARIPITYADPKAFDDTPQQAEKYQERSLQIATELFYVFSQIGSNS